MLKLNFKFKVKTVFSFIITVFFFYLLFSVVTYHLPIRGPYKWSILTIGSLLLFCSCCWFGEWRLKRLRQENQKLDSDLNQAIFDMMALFEFTNVLGSDLRLTKMMEVMADTIKRLNCYDGCCIFFYDESNQQFSPEANRGFPLESTTAVLPIKDLPGGVSVKSGQAVIINNIDEEFPDFKSKYPQFKGEFSSFLILPMIVERKLIGLLLLAKYAAFAYTHDDLRLLLIISNQAGLTIQNRRLYEQAYYSSITDGLTGVYNHKYFREQLDYQLEKAKEYGFKISLIMIDIDHFKQFNDNYGHQIGDKVLKEVSKLIQDCVNPDSLVARYGGEEFAVIVPDTPTEASISEAEKIRTAIEKHIIKTNEYSNLKVTVSLGVATFPDHIKNLRRMVVELIDIADDSLYSAKNSGRNRVCAPNSSVKAKLRKEKIHE